jgi:hypothetical protein
MIRDAARELPPVRWNRPTGHSKLDAGNAEAREPLAAKEFGLSAIHPIAREPDSSLFLRRDLNSPLDCVPDFAILHSLL